VSVSVTTNRRHPQQAQVVRRDDLGLLALLAMISNGQWSIVDQTHELTSPAWTIWAVGFTGDDQQWSVVNGR
jgi:hypothetical protein